VCASAPQPVCLTATQSKTWDTQGSCNGGLCVYASHVTTCSGGQCQNGACQSDPCAAITCNAPPSVCYGAAGVCSGGSCTYPFADATACNDNDPCTSNDTCAAGVCRGTPMACASPPANTCENASTLRVYNSGGTCALGACSYGYGFVSCPTGCSSGRCNPSGWVQMTSNTNVSLVDVWGANASAVWAVGGQGTTLFYNGAQWQVRPVPQQAVSAYITAVHGTAPNNVFALADPVLIHYDGTSWSVLADLTNYGSWTMGLYATGNATNDVYVLFYVGSTLGTPSKWLYRFDSTGKGTMVASFNDPSCWGDAHGVWFNSPTNIYMAGCTARQWDGSMVSMVGNSSTHATELWAAGPQSLFTLDYANGSSTSVTGLWGTAANRLFVSGYDFQYKGVLLYYDGQGFTRQAIPTGVGQLNAVWAAPSGEVFAVGAGGLIVKGP
jgi:hypothetical protein